MIRKVDGLPSVIDDRLLAIYKDGFAHVASVINQVECFFPDTANLLLDSYSEANGKLLKQIRAERTELEAEIKRFLARANSKLVYLHRLEQHLTSLQEEFEVIRREALEETEDSEAAGNDEGGEPINEKAQAVARRHPDQEAVDRNGQDAI